MKLSLQSIENAGDIERERVVLVAGANLDLAHFVILACKTVPVGKANRSKGAVVGGLPAAFWFGERAIKKGDYVILYTKRGRTAEKKQNSRKSYFYYWDRQETLWNGGIKPVLAQIATWDLLEDESELFEEPSTSDSASTGSVGR
jgi:hypothetical protein